MGLKKKVHICAGEGTKIIIGRDCVISNNVEIHTTDYHVIKDMNENRTNNATDIIIGDHVWLGLRSIILKGTYIAKGCIIGAGSIVTGRFNNEKTIITGCPAIEKRRNIIWER